MHPRDYTLSLPAGQRLAPFRLLEERVPDWTWFDANRARSRGGHPLNRVTSLVIHATAGWATQHALDNWRQRTASAHWIVPDEDEAEHGRFVWAVVSESLAAYHVKDALTHSDLGGRQRINDVSLGIEIVNAQTASATTDRFSDWQVAATASIARYCWAKYPNLRHIVSHARLDPTNRTDPGTGFPWDRFATLVLNGCETLAKPAIAPGRATAGAAGQGCCGP